MSDVDVRDEGSIVVLTPNTEAAQEWFDEHLPEECMRLGPGYVIEHRFADAIIEGLQGDGLEVT